MKRRTSTTVIICILFVLFFLIHQITLSLISRSSSASSTRIQESPRKLKRKPQWNPPPTAQPNEHSASTQAINCDRSHERYDLCSLNGQTVVDPTISTFFLMDPTGSVSPKLQKVRPHPRKWENDIMSHIKEVTLISTPVTTHCTVKHNAPALVFSVGGYTGNLFHDFNDGFIPLFITTRSIFPDHDPVFVIANCRDWWLSKYAELLRGFTPYPIINLDKDNSTHCFPSATIGLISHGYMTIDSSLLPHSDTFLTFRALLGSAYAHTSYQLFNSSITQPRIILVSRTGDVGRVIVNQAEVAQLAKEAGFEVVLFEPTRYTPLKEAYELINSSHAMLGVHGAALTHSLFLRPGSVFIQVVPIGIDWLAETCFGKPARDMGLEYMEYKIRVEESSLIDKYGKDDLVLRNPKALVKKSFSNTKNIYLKNQDIKMDLARVGKYLKKAYKKSKRFMDREG